MGDTGDPWVGWYVSSDAKAWVCLCDGPDRDVVVAGLRLAAAKLPPGCYAALPSTYGVPRWAA
jgi:hypothetical protein